MRPAFKNLLLLCGTLVVFFCAVEAGYRILDPFPYFSEAEINRTDHGNLSRYDETLGWAGVPNARETFVTKNSRTLLQHNRLGHRDVEHLPGEREKEAIVFLGDSYTWGYEVEFDEMFVNRLRQDLAGYSVHNLGHRGYGTDQSLLAFRQWERSGPVKLVVLTFHNNDVLDNNSGLRYDKPKPSFELVGDELVLTNVPVPHSERWQPLADPATRQRSLLGGVRDTLLRSHFFHDIWWKYAQYTRPAGTSVDPAASPARSSSWSAEQDFALTARILLQLRDDVEERGGRFAVAYVPANPVFERWAVPCEEALEETCRKLGVPYLDLTPAFASATFRIFFKGDIHLTPYGHEIVAQEMRKLLILHGIL